tara:strand:+ start:2354 stop:2563 length:210 start_codon:yes stop_codon:yes gene_type:complete
MMTVIRKSKHSGNLYTMEMNVTSEQISHYEAGGILLQDAFPQLNADEREFIKTGIPAFEWEQLFGGEGL